ncbi:MAG TPA: hypothetical protein VE954_08930 [Oligoflexus sp.]|uniref:hypothetical protein n=1 Tax=Oligoflexus sp. TaxID=1971216 RepID=UPI002D650273|nr:hypothetical protein [Oligoflexus sp.]HYX33226.1 hypothetical protein [Oligoflexus sp.]
MRKLQCLFAFSIIGITQHTQAAVIFDAANFCPTTQWDLFYDCATLPDKAQVTFQPSAVTEPTLSFLNSTPITNKINYKFECKTSNQFNVGVRLGEDLHPFYWNQTQEIKATYKLSEQGKKVYSLFFQPPTTSTPIWPGCTVDIITNVSYPDKDVLKEYANFLEISISDLVSLQGDVDVSVELPTKWAALKSSPGRIETVVTTLSIELSTYQAELAELQNDTSGSSDVSERKEVLSSLIESFSVDIQTLNLLSKDIKDVTSVGNQCETTTPEAYCLQAAANLTDKINKVISQKIETVKTFNTFIDAEVNRLSSISVSISNALKKTKVSTTAE